ncbi:DUF732 domain-containing protein [Mycobacterium sp. shizuoka-1]|uniref:DUF732 domain-containing protein n=1 Tax=Mycobacterium sp. shizuoka-1 TaxID=2039281 RepID=UPI000C0616B4|nr:DUF732 domain-containing protein [Mycobacterium sp. shizuoka-1]GAY16278.1 hypothetical protein MSZK_30040 [Mycobacterium sp. shizuoka-1]
MRPPTALLAAVAAVAAVATPAIAHADPDTDFANELHTIGVYGPRDYNAWIAKIACERLDRGVDHSAYDSAAFVAKQLPTTATTAQAWQFVARAYPIYCPDKQILLQQAAQTSGG